VLGCRPVGPAALLNRHRVTIRAAPARAGADAEGSTAETPSAERFLGRARTKLVPSLQQVWEDERRRRRERGQPSQMTQETSQERDRAVPMDGLERFGDAYAALVQQDRAAAVGGPATETPAIARPAPPAQPPAAETAGPAPAKVGHAHGRSLEPPATGWDDGAALLASPAEDGAPASSAPPAAAAGAASPGAAELAWLAAVAAAPITPGSGAASEHAAAEPGLSGASPRRPASEATKEALPAWVHTLPLAQQPLWTAAMPGPQLPRPVRDAAPPVPVAAGSELLEATPASPAARRGNAHAEALVATSSVERTVSGGSGGADAALLDGGDWDGVDVDAWCATQLEVDRNADRAAAAGTPPSADDDLASILAWMQADDAALAAAAAAGDDAAPGQSMALDDASGTAAGDAAAPVDASLGIDGFDALDALVDDAHAAPRPPSPVAHAQAEQLSQWLYAARCVRLRALCCCAHVAKRWTVVNRSAVCQGRCGQGVG